MLTKAPFIFLIFNIRLLISCSAQRIINNTSAKALMQSEFCLVSYYRQHEEKHTSAELFVYLCDTNTDHIFYFQMSYFSCEPRVTFPERLVCVCVCVCVSAGLCVSALSAVLRRADGWTLWLNHADSGEEHKNQRPDEEQLHLQNTWWETDRHTLRDSHTNVGHCRTNLSVCLFIRLSVRLSIHLSICPSFCLSICLSIRLAIYPSIYLSVFLSVHQSVYPSGHLSICLSIYLSVFLSVHLSVYPSGHLSICLSIYLSVFLSVHLSVYPSGHLSICLSIYLFICLSVCVYTWH